MAETIAMPKLGFDMQEGTLVRWVRGEGEEIHKGDVLAEIETDKATVEVESSASGIVRKLLVSEGDNVPIGTSIAIVGEKDERIEGLLKTASLPAGPAKPMAPVASFATQGPEQLAKTLQGPTGSEGAGGFKASPLARKMARAAHLDLDRVPGSGPGGRIVRRDIEAALAGAVTPGSGGVTRGMMSAPVSWPINREDEIVQPTKLRQLIGRRMVESKTSIPHFYVTYEYRVGSLIDAREQANAVLPNDEKISINDFVIKAAALSLRGFPNLNSAFVDGQVVRHGAINIGVAVAVEGGLLTVVCRDADQKAVRQISMEVRSMATRAREGKVRQEDVEGSTFTVSNLGMFDAESFAAIINPPEAAILAVGAARQVPVIQDGEIKPGWRMKATLAVDHRVSDGAEAARFLQALARYLEIPLTMFL